ncbi:unnamed protein product [Rhodiola kirilowii]
MRNLGCFQFNWNTQSVISGFVFSRFTQTLRAPGYVKATEYVGLCSERSEIDDALKLFDELPSRDVVSATAVISSFVRNNQYDKAMFLFFRMIASDIRPNEFTFGVLFQIPVAMYEGCIDDFGKRMGSNVGKQLHASAIKMGLISNVYAGSSALNFYSKVSDIEGATRVLEDTNKPNVVSYTTLICAYFKNEQFDDALSVFHTMPERNVVTWNAMIGGHSQTGKNEEAVNMFVEMLRGNVLPTQFTYPCVISAASNVAALGMGKSFHASAIKVLGNPNLFVGNSLVSFYSKCGTMEESLSVFNKLPHKNVVSWNAIICGYAQNGKAKVAIEFYDRMKDEGVEANDVTLLVLLLACNHGGLVEEGYSYFHKARIENPSMLKPEHYGCMVDLLSWSGRFQEAQHFISTMPFNAGIGFWKALLGGCQTHLNKELAEYAAKKILALVPGDVSSYVMLSNACSAAGNWQDVSMIRREMKEKKMQRIPGCSWIEIKSKPPSTPALLLFYATRASSDASRIRREPGNLDASLLRRQPPRDASEPPSSHPTRLRHLTSDASCAVSRSPSLAHSNSNSNSEMDSQYSDSISDSILGAGEGASAGAGVDSSINVTHDSTGGSGTKRKRPSTTLQNNSEIEQNEELDEACEKRDGRSWVWEHLKKFKKPVYEMRNGKRVQTDEVVRAKCNYCDKDFACNTYGNGTSTLKRHIENACKKYPGRVKINDAQQKLEWSEQGCREAAVKMIVMDELPFSFIEKEGFRYFCRYAVPDWHVPSRRVICKQFLKMYYAEKAKLKKELKGHCLCLTTDTWTSVQNINYMVVTAHFVDSAWKMQKRILSFKVIPKHRGESIGCLLEDCLLEWGVDRVLTISVDNASANKVAIDYIRERMLGWAASPFLVGSIRNAVRYVRSSGARLQQFKKCMEKEKVKCKKVCILDVPTRWNSTYLMLSTALELRKAFDRLAREEGTKYKGYFEEDEDLEDEDLVIGLDDACNASEGTQARKKGKGKRVGPPVTHDWEKAETFVRFLKIFYDVTMRISASTKPTSWKAFHDIVCIRAEIDGLFPGEGMNTGSETELILMDMAVIMKKKYEKYFATLDDCNQLLLIALVLNPRYKLRNFESTCKKWLKMEIDDIRTKSAELKDLLIKLCDDYNSKIVDVSSNLTKSQSGDKGIKFSSKKRTIEPTGIMKDMEEDWERELEDSNEGFVGHEVDRYLLDPIVKAANPLDYDILEWWNQNGDKYPGLAALAKDVMAIQVSTVASESSFSTSRRVIDPFRSSLSPKTVEALICYQNWMRSESIHNLQYIPTVEDIEFYEALEEEQAKEDELVTVDQQENEDGEEMPSKAERGKAKATNTTTLKKGNQGSKNLIIRG